MPSRERRRASREDAVTILSLIFAISGDLTMSRHYHKIGENGEKQQREREINKKVALRDAP